MRITDVSKLRGPLGELNDQLFGENGEERLAAFNLWLKSVVKKILKPIGDIALGSVEKFETVKNFTKANSKVKFWDFGKNFVDNFGNRVETNVPAATIAVSRLEQWAKDPEIINELVSDTKRFRINLAHFYQMIETQGQGQSGPLLVNGYANIAYIEGMENWAVLAIWNAGCGWYVYAIPVARPRPWSDEHRVLSRKSG